MVCSYYDLVSHDNEFTSHYDKVAICYYELTSLDYELVSRHYKLLTRTGMFPLHSQTHACKKELL